MRRALDAMRAQPHYRELFPAPRQRWVDALSLSEATSSRSIAAPVLLIHGATTGSCRSSDSVLPLLRALPDARAHVFGALRPRLAARAHRRVQPSRR